MSRQLRHLQDAVAVESILSLGPGENGLASIIIPAYNQGCFLAQTIESVIRQSYRPIECIIVDDGSTDSTAEVVARFAKLSDSKLRIQCLRQDNQGAQAARNAGVLASRGEYIQYLDGDDLLKKNKLKTQIDFLLSAPGVYCDVVYGDAQFLVAKGSHFQPGRKIGIGPTCDVFVGLLGGEFNPNFSYLCRRAAVQSCGPWDLSVAINQDYEYFLRMACRGFRFGYVSGMTGYYRQHTAARISERGMAVRARTTLQILISAEQIAEAAHQLNPARSRAFAKAYRNVSCWASGSDHALWRMSLSHSLRLCPDLLPDDVVARALQRLFGVWTSEALLGIARQAKRHFRSLS